LESTNGTRVNGQLVHVHRLRFGDCVHVGRSVLLFGSLDDINTRETQLAQGAGHRLASENAADTGFGTVLNEVREEEGPGADFTITDDATAVNSGESLRIGRYKFPPLPQKLTPSQAARLSEMLGFLHRSLANMLPAAQT